MNQSKRAEQLSQFILPAKMPAHIAIIMDGNGRWAQQRHLPRVAGHRAGMQTVRNVVSACGHWGIKALTLFAFSSENWGRPAQEVQFLMNLFYSTLMEEIDTLHQNNICLRIIGDTTVLNQELQQAIDKAQKLTALNTGLNLTIAINYGGRWDIVKAAQKIAEKVQHGLLQAADVTQSVLSAHMSLADLPEPDLFIRTSNELRISNFLLWQLAYTELYFPDCFWPDFDDAALHEAICAYAQRDRRYGEVNESPKVAQHA